MRTSDINYNHFWKPLIRTQYHMNGTDVINTLSEGGGSWGHWMQEARVKKGFLGLGKTKVNLIEKQNYVSNEMDMSVGYIKNRTYNLHTNGCSITFEGDKDDEYLKFKNIEFNDLKNKNFFVVGPLKTKTKYYIDYYSYNNGIYLQSNYLETNNYGELKLEFPTLTSTNPVVWYVVHQNAYSGLMQTEAPMAEREATLFEFQSTENDATSSDFRNSIYPNPFKNEIIVNSLDDDILIIKTLDGKVIYRQSVMQGRNEIILENLSDGLYLGELERQGFITKLEKR